MASGCKSSISFIDSRVPARTTYVSLHRWPESDAEFVKKVISGEKNLKNWGTGPPVVDSFACRQMYLRSYTFSKESKTQKCIGKVKERAADFPFICHRRIESGGGSVDGGSVKSAISNKKLKKKGCVGVKKLREGSYSAICSIFRRLLSCATSVDVVDSRLPP